MRLRRILAIGLAWGAAGCSEDRAAPPPPPLPETVAPSNPERVGPVATGSLVLPGPAVLDEALVYGTPTASEDQLRALAASVGGEWVGRLPGPALWQLRFANPANDPARLEAVLAALAASPLVEHAFANTLLSPLDGGPVYPDDGYSWDGHDDDCACSRAWDDPDLRNQVWGQRALDLPNAWKLTTGSATLPVAIVDTGFSTSPEPADFEGAGVHKYGSSLRNSHGDHVAGIVGARGNNRQGIAGVNWKSPLWLYEIQGWLGGNPPATAVDGAPLSQAMAGMLQASVDGARLVNLSFGVVWSGAGRAGVCGSVTDAQAKAWLEADRASWRPILKVLQRKGILVVAAAGNSSDGAGSGCLVDAQWTGGPQALAGEFPDNVLVVAAVGDPDGRGSYFGSWSDRWSALWPQSSVGGTVAVAAPGAQVLSLCNRWGLACLFASPIPGTTSVQYMSGTSMAAPFVTGIASLVWSMRPEWQPGQVKAKIVAGAKRGGRRVYRRVDPGHAEPVETFPFFVANAAQTLAILDLVPGCTDRDGDGYGAREPGGGAGLGCPYAGVDCDDTRPEVHPGVPELCNGRDDNCNGHTDEENVCQGTLVAAPVSGVVPGIFSTNGGDFSVSVSPLDPNGNLVSRNLTVANFSFAGIRAALLSAADTPVAEGSATPDRVEVLGGGTGGEAVSVAVLLDCSGSMADSDPGLRRVDAARELLRRLRAADRAALLSFGDGGDGSSVTRVLAPLSHDQAAWEAGLAQVGAVDGTPLYQAVAETVRYVAQAAAGGRLAVLVLTDGQSTEGDPGALRAAAISAARAAGMALYAVGLGDNLDFGGLEALGRESGGTFAYAADSQVLSGLFDAVGVAATQGRVVVHGRGSFSPPLSQPGRHVVSGALRTRVGSASVDTPFGFTVDIAH